MPRAKLTKNNWIKAKIVFKFDTGYFFSAKSGRAPQTKAIPSANKNHSERITKQNKIVVWAIACHFTPATSLRKVVEK